MSVIITRQLTRRYGRRIGILGVDLDVPEGVIYGFLGPNGAGKTTTIRVLLGFLKPTSGEARIHDVECWRGSARIKRDVGYLPGDLRLYSWMTGATAIGMVSRIRRHDLTTPGHELAERFRLDTEVPVRKMSRGMRQKLGLILALAHDPRLLVLDEPTSGLDPLMQDELAECLRERAARGRTVFFSSHTLREVEQLCSRVAIVRDGRLVADESIRDLRLRAHREATIEFQNHERAATTEPPAFLVVRRVHGATWRCELDGAAGALVRWCAAHAVADVVIGPPDLETLFRGYYERDGGA